MSKPVSGSRGHRVLHQTPEIGVFVHAEVLNAVDGVEADECGEQGDVGEGGILSKEKGSIGKASQVSSASNNSSWAVGRRRHFSQTAAVHPVVDGVVEGGHRGIDRTPG